MALEELALKEEGDFQMYAYVQNKYGDRHRFHYKTVMSSRDNDV
jgi:hypothetical protein